MKKILVVEDNPQNMYLITFILTENGYEVKKAASGEEGVEMALRDRPDLILMDIQLPGIDGLEAVRIIRAAGEAGRVPIIALTSYAMLGDREKVMEVGCNGYIQKPFDPETFISDIEKYLCSDSIKKE